MQPSQKSGKKTEKGASPLSPQVGITESASEPSDDRTPMQDVATPSLQNVNTEPRTPVVQDETGALNPSSPKPFYRACVIKGRQRNIREDLGKAHQAIDKLLELSGKDKYTIFFDVKDKRYNVTCNKKFILSREDFMERTLYQFFVLNDTEVNKGVIVNALENMQTPEEIEKYVEGLEKAKKIFITY